MSLIVQTVFANLIDWLFKPVDNLCSRRQPQQQSCPLRPV